VSPTRGTRSAGARFTLRPLKAKAQALLATWELAPPDAVLALAITALLQAELWIGERYQGSAAFPGSKGVDAIFLAIAGLALAWRRRFPLPAFAVAMGALSLESIVSGGPEAGGTFLLLLVAVYSAAAYGDQPLLTAAITAAALVVHDLTDPFVHGAGDMLFALIFAVVGFGFGRAVHSRRIRSSLLEEEATRLQTERDEAVAAERARIARELHDIIAHSVSLMVVQAIAGQRTQGGAANGAAQRALGSIESTGRQAMSEMRRLLAILHEDDPGPASPQPSLGQLPELIAEVERAGLDVRLVETGDRPQLSPGLELALYRIAQEALTNSLKHAGPTQVEIELGYRPHEVELSVRDQGGDGTRDDDPAWSGGNGLAGMRERAAIYGGELRTTRGSSGFELAVRLPISERAQ
jgi:signal transduction histidine kinase